MRVQSLSVVRPLFAAGLSVLAFTTAQAQGSRAAERKARADSLAAVVQLIEQRIMVADSSRDPVAASAARLELAVLLPPKPALQLVAAAAAALDTIGAPELALRAHRELAGRYAAQKMHDRAYAEWAAIVTLTERMRDDALREAGAQRAENTALGGKVEELSGSLNRSVAVLAQRTDEHARKEELASWTIIGGAALLLLSVLFFAWHGIRRRKVLKELRAEVDRLRAELARMLAPAAPPAVVRPAVAVEEAMPPMPAPLAPVEQVGPAVAPATDEEAVLLAMVRRRGEERLRTLREARARGDHDKVVRVVHTMKPQLVSLDATYFQDLCGRLVSTDPGADPARWAADLDRFEQGMARVLGEA